MEIVSGGEPNRAEGRIREAESPVSLVIRDGRVLVMSGGEEIARATAPKVEAWRGVLRVELVGGPGAFSEIVIEQGP